MAWWDEGMQQQSLLAIIASICEYDKFSKESLLMLLGPVVLGSNGSCVVLDAYEIGLGARVQVLSRAPRVEAWRTVERAFRSSRRAGVLAALHAMNEYKVEAVLLHDYILLFNLPPDLRMERLGLGLDESTLGGPLVGETTGLSNAVVDGMLSELLFER
tara:strand:- start:1 stop:477 length:477 start_codon:yes stop_codon:yes gene_type:complete